MTYGPTDGQRMSKSCEYAFNNVEEGNKYADVDKENMINHIATLPTYDSGNFFPNLAPPEVLPESKEILYYFQ